MFGLFCFFFFEGGGGLIRSRLFSSIFLFKGILIVLDKQRVHLIDWSIN